MCYEPEGDRGYAAIDRIITGEDIKRVIVAQSERRGQLPVDSLIKHKFQGTNVDDGVDFYETLVGKILVENLHPSWFVFPSGFNRVRLTVIFQSVIDIGLSLVLSFLALPLFLIISMLIRFESKAPYFSARSG